MRRIVLLLASTALALLLASGAGLSGVVNPAEATAPGLNGKIVANGTLDFFEVLTINPDGTNKTPIAPSGIQAVWSPDGSKVAFVKTADEQIYVVNADGSGQRQLTSFPDSVYEPTWSPDGSKIAFRKNIPGGGSDIYVMNIDGSHLTRLTIQPDLGEGYDVYGSPDWSSEGSKIAYVSSPGQIWTMNASDGANKTRVAYGYQPSWSPDGTKLAFANSVYSAELAEHREIFVQNLSEGSAPTRLTYAPLGHANALDSTAPDWSPDGTKIVFNKVDAQASDPHIVVMNADGSGQTDITPEGRWGSPDWGVKTTVEPPPPPDTTSPKVTSTVPNVNATGVAPTVNVKATFSENMKASTINSTTFTLRKQNATGFVATSVTYDPSTDTATLDPTISLRRGATYKASVNLGAQDLAGNPLDQNASLSGSQRKDWIFKIKP